jgi:t-SNARE complex subunit (syntaxin)
MEASELKKVKKLEEENAKLKRMYADLALDDMAKYVIEKEPCTKQIVTELKTVYPRGISKACRVKTAGAV